MPLSSAIHAPVTTSSGLDTRYNGTKKKVTWVVVLRAFGKVCSLVKTTSYTPNKSRECLQWHRRYLGTFSCLLLINDHTAQDETRNVSFPNTVLLVTQVHSR